MTKSMGSDNINTRTVDPTKDSGPTENKTGKGFSSHHKGPKEKEYGKVEKELNGSTNQSREKVDLLNMF